MRKILLTALVWILFGTQADAMPFEFRDGGFGGGGGMGRGHMSIAARYVGRNPTGWSHKWCGKYVDMVLEQSGKRGGGNLAMGYARYGHPSSCRPGAIAVMRSHVGFVTSCNGRSTTIISGNHSGRSGHRTVGYGTYSNARIVAYRYP